jgi:dethiobiotin synthase
MRRGLFVTGTDTGIGKTLASTLLLSALRQSNFNATYFKPVQTGSDDDTTTVAKLSNSKLPPPRYKFPQGISPHWAAALNNEEILLSEIEKSFQTLARESFVITEGAGGILVPLNSKQNIRDLIVALSLPLLLVSSTRLGTINHTLLTIEAARTRDIPILGVILSGPQDEKLIETLEGRGQVKILAQVPPFKINEENISSMAREIFPKPILEIILGASL